MIIFEEEGLETPNYTVYVRNTDGSPATAIGEGYGDTLSRDKKWALSTRLNRELWLLPIGPGEPRRISPPGFIVSQASFLSDGKRVVYIARKGTGPTRTWMQGLDGGDPRPITPENIIGFRVSLDDKWLLAWPASDATQSATLIVPLAGGAPIPIAGLKSDESPMGWTTDGRLYIGHNPKRSAAGVLLHATSEAMSVPIEKLDPHTGTRTAWRDIPLIPIGGVGISQLPVITPDGSSYAYGYLLARSDLYTITGPR